tara:strand:- start:91 stop:459 length:369 start_codon:yes stop_codon:yes gene_type:complete
LFTSKCGNQFYISNGADLAGVAEMNLGVNINEKGVALVITVGTGTGSGLFIDGKLVSNLEVGKLLHTNGEIIELYTADSMKKKEELSLKRWAKRFDKLLKYVRLVFSLEVVILGGGISKKLK